MRSKLTIGLAGIVLAILASTIISTWYSLDNVSACVQAPGCVQQGEQPIGKLQVRNHGFPATYKQTSSFIPKNNDSRSQDYAGYAVASAETMKFNAVYIGVNMVFWLALVYTLYAGYLHFKPTKAKSATTTRT